MVSTELKHICFIMDGNRTHTIMENLHGTDEDFNYHSYYSGAEALEKLMHMTFNELKVQYLTINLIGRENCVKRKSSARAIANLVPHFFGDIWASFFKENEIRVKFVGDLDMFCNSSEDPEGLREEIKKVEERTATFDKNHLIAMAAYDPAHEYGVFFGKIQTGAKLEIEDWESYNQKRAGLTKLYYGFDVPRVDVMIRTWRPKLSAMVPILVGEYADIYLFPAPFQIFDLAAYKKIAEDYKKRALTPDTEEIWHKGGNMPVRDHKEQIKATKPVVIGSESEGVWLPCE
ncbi:Ditrans,polycis-undecaprenyl-diphosphate synthase ((2E,6E)-farnesyl-diphosphate specific) [uncultured archaeon]|nr:Ditrans,polycis-undecaprenyl-diphosphate synthase ((2E,6E)-farnesyl-diphosphate specific) [uncultured archaeon]